MISKDQILLRYDPGEDKIYITPQIDIDHPIKIIVRDPSTGLTIYYWKNIEKLTSFCSYFLKPFNAFSFSDFTDFIAFQIDIYDSLTRQRVYSNLLGIRNGEVTSNFQFVISDAFQDCSYFQYWEMNHLKIYDPVNTNLDGKVVVDLGSAYGVYTKRALDLKASKIYAIEPSKSFEFIQMSFNREESVIPIKCAISSYNGESDFFYSDSLTTSRLEPEVGSQIEKVQVRRLDDLLHHEPEIEFIKMDIEGEEYKVIDSLDLSFFNKVNKWAIEFHHNDGYNVQKLLNKMVSMGYKYNIKRNNSIEDGDITMYDGYMLFWR